MGGGGRDQESGCVCVGDGKNIKLHKNRRLRPVSGTGYYFFCLMSSVQKLQGLRAIRILRSNKSIAKNAH